MPIIAPTITTNDKHYFRSQLELIESYSDAVHIDYSDGVFAPNKSLDFGETWLPDEMLVHLHIMYSEPVQIVAAACQIRPDLIILHAESKDLRSNLQLIKDSGLRGGIALLPETTDQDLAKLEVKGLFDHLLVFAGNLGHQGGVADLSQLDKVRKLRSEYSEIQIGWDGGINQQNIAEIAAAGVDVFNVGGYLKNAEKPKTAYNQLNNLVSLKP